MSRKSATARVTKDEELRFRIYKLAELAGRLGEMSVTELRQSHPDNAAGATRESQWKRSTKRALIANMVEREAESLFGLDKP